MLGSKGKKKKLPLPEEPARINSPSLMERLRAVPVEYDDPFAGEVYRPKGQAAADAKVSAGK
jgi:hypothetical protein